MKNSTLRAIKKYGKENCLKAYSLNVDGNGANTIGFLLGVRTNTADAMINAGREISSVS